MHAPNSRRAPAPASAPSSDHNPCVRRCCLDDKDICLGCFRHVDEICAWHTMSTAERERTLERMAARKKATPSHR